MRLTRWLLAGTMLSLSIATGCGDDGALSPNGADAVGGDVRPWGRDGVNVELPDPEPIVITGRGTSCFVDGECAADTFCFQGLCHYECDTDGDCDAGDTCGERRRCVSGAAEQKRKGKSAATIIPGVGIVNVPPTVYTVAPGQGAIDLVIEPSAPIEGGAIAYSLTRFDTVTRVIETDPQLYRASGTTLFTIPVETGVADPDSPIPGEVRVDVRTSIGSLSITLLPQARDGGRYTGRVRVSELMGAALPVDMEVVTVPPNTDLAAATEAWLVLPVRPDALFAPHAVVTDGPDAVAQPLTYDAFTQSWVATFVHSFALAEDGPFGALAAGSVERTLRAEVEVVNGRLVGRLSDRWAGLFDERSEAGVRSPGDVVFEGELDLGRVGDARDVADLPTPATLPAPAPQMRELPSLDVCEGVALGPATSATVDGTTYSCAPFDDLAELTASSDGAARLGCAIAVAEQALAGDTVARQIASFIAGTSGGQSFADFIEDCAERTNGTCVPAPEVLCGRQLLAYTYQLLEGTSPLVPRVVSTYRAVNREANLGPQLAAFHVDTQTRLSWLQNQNFDAVITSAIRGLNADLLNAWREDVLEVHLEVLSDQFSAGALATLARASSDPLVRDTRSLMLLELSQSWRASVDALALAATRWSDLHQDIASRTGAARYVREKLFDLYVMSGVLAELNRLADAGFASAAFAGGFAAVANELQELSQPFSALVFTRDAEVVVSTSLDPTMNNDTVLSSRRAAAMLELERAADSVTSTLADLQSDLVDESTLRGRLQTQIDELYAELVELCGFPEGCSLADREDPGCRPRTEPGKCGFAIDADTDAVMGLARSQPSEASAAVLDYLSALQDVDIARADLDAQENSVDRFHALTEDFVARVEDWKTRRAAADDNITLLVEQAQARRGDSLANLTRFLDEGREVREAAAAEREAWLAQWDAYEDEVAEDVGTHLKASKTASTAAGLQVTADVLLIGADALFGGAGADSGSVQKGLAIAGAVTAGVGAAFTIAAGATQATADYLAAEVERNGIKRDFEMSRDEFEFELETARRDDELANIEAEMEALATAKEFDDGILESIIDQIEGTLADELAYERDLAEIDDRRAELNDRIDQLGALRIRVAQAGLTALQRLHNYDQVIQRAQLLDGRLMALEAQAADLNELLGSPTVVFGWANRLTQAESRLERAKKAMMEWLVALEYLAVRPFLDQRIQILLARNTYQLEDIAAELERLQSRCGGALNVVSVTVSLAEDLLGIVRPIAEHESGEVRSPGERFREILAQGAVPIDKRVRYTTDSTIGDLVTRADVLAATFDINLTDFANLAATCNAKISSIALELVGQSLGTARPTVSLLYDGASSVRSCQPNIDAIVESIGRTATTFGPITTFRTAGRSVSPTAGINTAGSVNETLRGLPLASQYTVLVDPVLGENRNIAWDRLEDIVLHVTFVSQDVFPVGQCE